MFLPFSSFYFQNFGTSLLPLLWILFQVNCLLYFHLFILICFYLTPSSVVYFFFCHFLYLFLMNGTVPILLVVWLKVSSSGACRLLGRVRSWHWDVEFRDTILWFMSPGPRYSLLVQQFRLSALLPQEHRPGLWPMNQDPIASGYCKKRTMKNRSILKE